MTGGSWSPVAKWNSAYGTLMLIYTIVLVWDIHRPTCCIYIQSYRDYSYSIDNIINHLKTDNRWNRHNLHSSLRCLRCAAVLQQSVFIRCVRTHTNRGTYCLTSILADRTATQCGRLLAWYWRLSVCLLVTKCTMAKRRIPQQQCLNRWIGNVP